MKKNKKKRNINWKSILYKVRIFSTIVFLVLLLFLVPNILNSGWQGLLFLILSLILIGVSLYTMLLKNNLMIDQIPYNLLYIGMVSYLFLISYRLLFDSRVKLTMIYEIDMTYFKVNYLILSFIIIGIILYTILFTLEEKKSVK